MVPLATTRPGHGWRLLRSTDLLVECLQWKASDVHECRESGHRHLVGRAGARASNRSWLFEESVVLVEVSIFGEGGRSGRARGEWDRQGTVEIADEKETEALCVCWCDSIEPWEMMGNHGTHGSIGSADLTCFCGLTQIPAICPGHQVRCAARAGHHQPQT